MADGDSPGAARLGVIGWPVAHSRSPDFQNAALAHAGLEHWRYQRLPIPPERFEETVRALPRAGFRGVNVTLPHKERALALADEPTARARAIGAANTLVFEPDGTVVADNTDAPALIAVLPFELHGSTALVLGAGGSARAAVWALRDAGAQVRVWNRHPERARALCGELGGTPVSEAVPADLLVNCTSVGMRGGPSLEALPVTADDLTRYRAVVDFVYRDGETELLQIARSAQVPAVDGLELLVAQGAQSFESFTGRSAPIAVMREAVGLS